MIAYDMFSGEIHEVRISKIARYADDRTPKRRFEPATDTLGLHHIDDGERDNLKDSSSHERHGKILGAK